MKDSLLKKAVSSFGLVIVLSLILTHPSVGAKSKPEAGMAKKVEYTSQYLRDPFKNPFEIFEAKKEEPTEKPPLEYGLPHLKVRAMIWGTKMPQTIINDTVLRIGEVIEGAEILDIRKEGVYVLYKGRQYIIRPATSKAKQ